MGLTSLGLGETLIKWGWQAGSPPTTPSFYLMTNSWLLNDGSWQKNIQCWIMWGEIRSSLHFDGLTVQWREADVYKWHRIGKNWAEVSQDSTLSATGWFFQEDCRAWSTYPSLEMGKMGNMLMPVCEPHLSVAWKRPIALLSPWSRV